jgi:DNA-binding IclR family transcriptional regulator
VATPKNLSVLKAFALLRAFQRPDEALTSAELSRRVGLPEASGYRLIQSLEAAGAVAKDERGRYVSNWTSQPDDLAAGQRVSPEMQLVLEALATRFGATAHAGVLDRGMVTYVGKAVSEAGTPVPTLVGAQQEAYCSALGKTLLAALCDADLDAYLQEGELIPLTENTITDPQLFRAEIQRVREQGFAVDLAESHPDLACVAAPLRSSTGQVIAAISVVDRIDRMDDDRRDQVRRAVVEAADIGERKVFAAISLLSVAGAFGAAWKAAGRGLGARLRPLLTGRAPRPSGA